MIGYDPADERVESDFLPVNLPATWQRRVAPGPTWLLNSPGNPHHGLTVLLSVGTEMDGRLWLHVSASHPRRIPTWEDMALVKRLFVGENRYAYQVMAPASKHYTLRGRGRAEHVLHLWAPLEGSQPLPDFLSARGGTL